LPLSERFCRNGRQSGLPERNWLFFGERHADSDFYYQDELSQMVKNRLLTRVDTAFSRDQDHKVYVQHRMLENAGLMWDWLQDGARYMSVEMPSGWLRTLIAPFERSAAPQVTCRMIKPRNTWERCAAIKATRETCISQLQVAGCGLQVIGRALKLALGCPISAAYEHRGKSPTCNL
jgi:Oxidoreductase NAD-binding domain